MDYMKVNKLHSIGDTDRGDLCVHDDRATLEFSVPSPTHYPPMPKCKPPKPSAEEMLKKALEFANQGMRDIGEPTSYTDDEKAGKYYTYEDMAAHLEMLIKEAKQNG